MSASRKSILLVGLADKPESVATIESYRPWLAKRCRVLDVVLDQDAPLAAAAKADFVVTFGGDGLLLSTARRMQLHQKPIVGVNLGTLGYMAEFSPGQFRDEFDAILAGKLPPRDRMMLYCCVAEGDAERFCTVALNDVVITGGRRHRMIRLRLTIDGRAVTTVHGDGLIVATPTGSTAYNLAAGGPILMPRLKAIAVTPICPHTLTQRPLVLDDDAKIEIACPHPRENVQVFVDGQLSADLDEASRVQIRKADVAVRLIENPAHTAFDQMASKLHWGRSAMDATSEGN